MVPRHYLLEIKPKFAAYFMRNPVPIFTSLISLFFADENFATSAAPVTIFPAARQLHAGENQSRH
jgi:hypothetical protein